MRKRKTILTLASKCESSARRLLRSLGNPPNTKMTSNLSPVAGHCYRVLSYVKQLRRAIEHVNASDAGLAGFRLGQAVYVAAIQPMIKDSDKGRGLIAASQAGAATTKSMYSVKDDIVKSMIEQFQIMRASNPRISIARASEILSPRLHVKPRTIRKYLAKAQKSE
jgi:hypothetical protein